jgi:hypothetical protein
MQNVLTSKREYTVPDRKRGNSMGFHNDTCGCPDCGNYGQRYNPGAVHNQSCGCPQCGNYGPFCGAPKRAKQDEQDTVLIEVPVELEEEVRALIVRHRGEGKPSE